MDTEVVPDMASVNLPVSLMEEGRAAEPVPVREMMCGLPVALSVMVMAPVLVPVAVGVKVTEMVQLAPAAMKTPQLVVCAKSPLGTMLVMSSDALPVFVSVTVCAELVVFIT